MSDPKEKEGIGIELTSPDLVMSETPLETEIEDDEHISLKEVLIPTKEFEGSIETTKNIPEEVSAPERIDAEKEEVILSTNNNHDNEENQDVSIPIDDDTGGHICKIVVVTLKNDPLEKFPDLQGTYYHKIPDKDRYYMKNGKPSWGSRIREKQIWYDIEHKRWVIGNARDNFGYILGKTQDHFIMPCAESSWKYENGSCHIASQLVAPFGYGKSGEANEIHIQCKAGEKRGPKIAKLAVFANILQTLTENSDIDWSILQHELMTWEFSSFREKDDLVLTLFIGGALFTSSFYDVVSDSLVAEQFFTGTNYTKDVPFMNDTFVNAPYSPNCTFVGHQIYVDSGGNVTTEFFRFDCFEDDPFWGSLVSTFIFLPGVLFWSLIAYQERKKNLWRPFLRNLCLPLLLIPLIPAFPIILSLVKFLAIFNQGVQMNRLKTIVSLCEGQIESFLQLGLQIYIILERLDRKPSSVQLAALPISLLMIVMGQANAWFSNNPEPDLTKDIKRKVMITPILMVFNVLFIGVPAVVLAIDKMVFLHNAIALVAVIAVLMAINKFCECCKISSLSKFFYLLTSLWLTGLIIWATYSANAGLYPEVNIIKSGYFGIASGVLIACNPILWLFALILISLTCLIVFGIVGLVASVLVTIITCDFTNIGSFLCIFGCCCCGPCFACFEKLIN